MRFLIVFNTCGLPKNNLNPIKGDNSNIWIGNLLSLMQKYNSEKYDCDFILSDCCSPIKSVNVLKNELSDIENLYFNFIREPIPVFQTCNASIKKMEQIKKYDYVIYVDSGISIGNFTMDSLFQTCIDNPNYGIILAPANNDNEEHQWRVNLYSDKKIIEFRNNQSLNLHVMAMSSKIGEIYGKYFPDNFCGCGSENFYWYISNSIGLKYGYIPANILMFNHILTLDGRNLSETKKLFYSDLNPYNFAGKLVNYGVGLALYLPPLKPFPINEKVWNSYNKIKIVKELFYHDFNYDNIKTLGE